MVWTASQLAKESGLTRQHITRLLRKGKEMKAKNPQLQSGANWIIGEQTSAGWIVPDEEAQLFIQSRSEESEAA